MNPVTLAIALLEHEQRPYSILQIGAFTGNTPNDPLWPIFSSGEVQYGTLIAVEPVRTYYNELVENYRPCPNVKCLNWAISAQNGIQPIFRLDTDPRDHGMPDWLAQLSSLLPERLGTMWNQWEGRDPANAELRTFCLEHLCADLILTKTLRATMETLNTPPIEMIIIDAEGSEEQILPQITFPLRFLSYEHALIEPQPNQEGHAYIRQHMDTFRFQANDTPFLELLAKMAVSN